MFKFKRRQLGKYLTGIFNIADLAVVNILFALTLAICPDLTHLPCLRTLWVLVNTSYLPVMMWMVHKPHQQRVLLMDHVLRSAFAVVGIHALFFLALVAFLEIEDIPTHAYVVFYGLMLTLIPLWWIISRHIIKQLRRKGYNFTRVAIIGTGSTAMRLLEQLRNDSGFGYRFIGFADDTPPPADFPERYLGTLDELDEAAKRYHIDQVFYAISGEDTDAFTKVLKAADNNMMQFYYVPRISRSVARSFELHSVGTVPVLSVRHNSLSSLWARALKRTFDFAFSTVALIFSPIIFVPVAIAIKMSSPGPIFFVQERTGYRGRTFKCLKFRTMRVNNSADSQQATSTDPRTTKVGQFLRRTSIDELPQFINVWLGQMSIVGPRPHMLMHTKEYTELIDNYMVRHAVKPGITGWAQINGYRGATDELWKMEKRVESDVWYIENWSFWLDLKIIARTVINAFSGEENAY